MKKQDVLWVDFIRVIATFFVVLLHSAAPLCYKYNELSITDWWAGNLYNSMTKMSIPLFFMISGYLLLEKQETMSIFFMKRIDKVIIPLIIWSIFYILWRRYYQCDYSLSFYNFFILILTPVYFHLWFLYAIAGIYLYVPILRVIVQNSTQRVLYYFVVLWFMAVSLIPIFEKATHLNSDIDLKMISGYVGYLVLGHLLGHTKITQKYFFISILTTIITLIVTSIGTYYFTTRNEGQLSNYFYSYLSPNVVFMSISTFIILKYISEESNIFKYIYFKTIIKSLSAASMGIYLIHIMFLFILTWGDLSFLSVFSYSAIYSIPITAIATFGVSFIVIYFIRKIPILRKCC